MSGTRFTFAIDTRVYDLDVVQRAAVKFTDFAAFDFRIQSDISLVVTAAFKEGLTVTEADFLARFNNELLDQSLRARVFEETKTERDLILAYAFSNSKLIES